MKFSFFIFLISLSLSAFAQEINPQSQGQPKTPAKPIDNIKEEQEALDGKNVNDFDSGPYDREGKYIYYDRQLEEMKAAREGKELEEGEGEEF